MSSRKLGPHADTMIKPTYLLHEQMQFLLHLNSSTMLPAKVWLSRTPETRVPIVVYVTHKRTLQLSCSAFSLIKLCWIRTSIKPQLILENRQVALSVSTECLASLLKNKKQHREMVRHSFGLISQDVCEMINWLFLMKYEGREEGTGKLTLH